MIKKVNPLKMFSLGSIAAIPKYIRKFVKTKSIIMNIDFFFPPYEGELYGKSEGVFGEIRVMALGHSHYCNGGYNPELINLRIPANRCIIRCDKNCANYGSVSCPNRTGRWTADAADNFIKSGTKDKTNIFSKFAHILNCFGNEIECWKSLAHYNFLQAAVGNYNKEGNNAEIDFSRILVAEAFKKLAPDIIIVWGEQKVFNHVFKYLPDEFVWTPGNYDFPCGTIRIGDKTAKVIGIAHPIARKYAKVIDTERIKTIASELFKK